MSLETKKAKRTLLEAEIKLKKQEWAELNEEILSEEWVPITWDELEKLLKEEYPGSHYKNNPRVSQELGRNCTYCFIEKGGKLQVGAWFHNDRFPRGKSLYIHHKRAVWG
ncbi:MAG: hypothetical protein ACWA44_02535 [Thiotrichales bacterium]